MQCGFCMHTFYDNDFLYGHDYCYGYWYTLGVIAGLCGGKVDAIISFFTDVRLSVPTTFIGIIFACIMGANPVLQY